MACPFCAHHAIVIIRSTPSRPAPEMNALLAPPEGSTPHDQREYAVAAVSVQRGARASEVTQALSAISTGTVATSNSWQTWKKRRTYAFLATLMVVRLVVADRDSAQRGVSQSSRPMTRSAVYALVKRSVARGQHQGTITGA
jgi:hypothetical protein